MSTPTGYTKTDMKLRLVAHFKEWFRGRSVGDAPMVRKVLPSYPSSPQVLPCLTVRQMGDTVESTPVGIDFGIGNDGQGTPYEIEGAFWRESFEIRYITANVELRDLVRPWLRAGIFETFRPFDELGVQLPQVSGGEDQEDFSEQAPKELYMLAYQVSFRVPILRTHAWWEKVEGIDIQLTTEAQPEPDPAFAARFLPLQDR